MNLTDENKIISSKNKAFRNWKKHNFIFKKFSSLLYEKIIDIKKEFKDVLVITSDFDETISEISKIPHTNISYLSQYKLFVENINIKNIQKVFSPLNKIPFKEESFDLVVCNFCFHNISAKIEYLKNLKKILKNGGLLVCNYFGEDSLVELKNSFILADEKIYGGSFLRFPKNLKLVEFSGMLANQGFSEIITEKINFEIFYNNVFQILKDIKGIGEDGFINEKKKKISRLYLKELDKVYKKNFSNADSKLQVTCEIVSSSSWKPL